MGCQTKCKGCGLPECRCRCPKGDPTIAPKPKKVFQMQTPTVKKQPQTGAWSTCKCGQFKFYCICK